MTNFIKQKIEKRAERIAQENAIKKAAEQEWFKKVAALIYPV